MSKLTDRFQRPITYLRISITDHCNLACSYCTPEKPSPKLAHEEILSFEEILRLARIAVSSGIQKIRITGGEPLARRGVGPFLMELGRTPGLQRLALTTNAVLLHDLLPDLLAAGVDQLNISMDTLKRETFQKITGRDRFCEAWKGIRAAQKTGTFTIKLNAVALRGVNDMEIADLAALSLQENISVRFIEEMPIGRHHLQDRPPMLIPEIREKVMAIGPLLPVESSPLDGPAERFRIKGAAGEVGFISALSRHFCGRCNRLRLTSDGRLRACLLSDQATDIKTPMRNGASDDALAELFTQTVMQKGQEHHFRPESTDQVETAMQRIGG